jgi:hypothetical protein
MYRFLVSLLCLVAIVGCGTKPEPPAKPLTATGVLTSGGNINTSITKGCNQYGLPFSGNSYTLTGVQAPYGELNVSAGTNTLLNDGIGNVQLASLQMFYGLLDTTDGTLSFYANSAGTGSAGTTIAMTAGTPVEWDTTSGTAVCPIAASWQSLRLSAGTTAGGTATSATSTNVHLRSSLSQ